MKALLRGAVARVRKHGLVVAAVVLFLFTAELIARSLAGDRYVSVGLIEWTDTFAQYDAGARTLILASIGQAANMQRVAQRLKLTVPPERIADKITTSSPRAPIVAIQAEWTTADGAALLANTVIDVFLESRIKEATAHAYALTERQRDTIAETERRRANALAAYADFQKEHGVSDVASARRELRQGLAKVSSPAERAVLEARLYRVSALEGLEARLRGELDVIERALREDRPLLAKAEHAARQRAAEFRLLQRARAPAEHSALLEAVRGLWTE